MFCLTKEHIFVLAWLAKRQKTHVSMQWSSVKFWIPMWIICRGHKPLAAFFIQLCKRSAHKGSQEELPPFGETWWFHLSVPEVCVWNLCSQTLIVSLEMTHAWLSLSANVMSLSRDCMHLCSQGPHLWPFILSQVKGLRDTGAHQHTDDSVRRRQRLGHLYPDV